LPSSCPWRSGEVEKAHPSRKCALTGKIRGKRRGVEGEASPRRRKGLQYRIHGGTFSFHDWLTTRMRSAITTTATCDPILNENGKEEARERNGEAGANTHTKDGRAIEPRLLEVGEDIHRGREPQEKS